METLLSSVGRHGQNQREDVRKVQELINTHRRPDQRPLSVDGICGSATIQAIIHYQRHVLHALTVDGRVDPGGPTLRSLNTQAAAPAPQPVVVPTPAGTVQSAMVFFTDQGWTPAQAAGIVANLVAESDLQPSATGDAGNAYGIAQWHAGRQQAFQDFTGRPIQGTTFQDQMQFVQHELTTGAEHAAGNRLRNTTSANDAGSVVSQYYERPADRQGEAARRGARAENILQSYPNPSPATH